MNWLMKLILPKWVQETVIMLNEPCDDKFYSKESKHTDWVTPSAFVGM